MSFRYLYMSWSNEKIPKNTRSKTAKVYKKRGKFRILKLSKTIINFLKKLRGEIADRPPPFPHMWLRP